MVKVEVCLFMNSFIKKKKLFLHTFLLLPLIKIILLQVPILTVKWFCKHSQGTYGSLTVFDIQVNTDSTQDNELCHKTLTQCCAGATLTVGIC